MQKPHHALVFIPQTRDPRPRSFRPLVPPKTPSPKPRNLAIRSVAPNRGKCIKTHHVFAINSMVSCVYVQKHHFKFLIFPQKKQRTYLHLHQKQRSYTPPKWFKNRKKQPLLSTNQQFSAKISTFSIAAKRPNSAPFTPSLFHFITGSSASRSVPSARPQRGAKEHSSSGQHPAPHPAPHQASTLASSSHRRSKRPSRSAQP